MNTIKIFISCNENIQIFTRASHSWKYWCLHYTRWQYLWYSQQKSKYPLCHGQITLSKIDKISLSAIPNQIFMIMMHTPSLVKIHWQLLKLSSRNENSDILQEDNSVKNWRNLPTNNPKPDLHNINAHTRFGESPLTFTQVIIWKGKYGLMDGRTYMPTWHLEVSIFCRIPHYEVDLCLFRHCGVKFAL